MNPKNDLIALIEHDLGQGRKSGRWNLFHCPFPGHAHGDRKPSLAVTNGDGNRGAWWKCFTCGQHGGAIKWMMEYHNMSYQDALVKLKIPVADQKRFPPALPIQKADNPPCEAWQDRAWALVERAEAALWDDRGKGALAWLRDRGLDDITICAARLGYFPKNFVDDPKAWGKPNGEIRPMYFYEGLVIPGQIGGVIWYLKMRPAYPSEGQKYKHVRGGKQALYLAEMLSEDLPAVFCEGELDALLLKQETRGMVDVITLASATSDLNLATWGIYLLRPPCFILAQDMDAAGEKSAAKLAWLHNSKRLQIPSLVPGAKDLTDYHKAGGDLRELIQSTLIG